MTGHHDTAMSKIQEAESNINRHSFEYIHQQQNRPIVALVLGSGGARGYAHIGVIEVLEQHGIRPDFIVGTNGTVVPKDVYDMSDKDFIQTVANISNEKVNENLKAEGKSIYGHVAGTKKHTEAANIVKEYQDNMKSRNNLAVEKNWKDNVRINGNEKRSTRLDVYDKDTNTVYDYKFVKNPGKGLSKRQVEKIKKEGPLGLSNEDIIEINPN